MKTLFLLMVLLLSLSLSAQGYSDKYLYVQFSIYTNQDAIDEQLLCNKIIYFHSAEENCTVLNVIPLVRVRKEIRLDYILIDVKHLGPSYSYVTNINVLNQRMNNLDPKFITHIKLTEENVLFKKMNFTWLLSFLYVFMLTYIFIVYKT